LLLAAVDCRIGLIDRLTEAVSDSRHPSYITYSMRDPLFKLAARRVPLAAYNALACGATVSRLDG
jgi:hypothetical protein